MIHNIRLGPHEEMLDRYLTTQRFLRGMLIYFSFQAILLLLTAPIAAAPLAAVSTLHSPVLRVVQVVLTAVCVWLMVFFLLRYTLKLYARFSQAQFRRHRVGLLGIVSIPTLVGMAGIAVGSLTDTIPGLGIAAQDLIRSPALLASVAVVTLVTWYFAASYCLGVISLTRCEKTDPRLLSFAGRFPDRWLNEKGKKLAVYWINAVGALKHLYLMPETLDYVKKGKGRLVALFVLVAFLESMLIFPLWGSIHQWLGIASEIASTCNGGPIIPGGVHWGIAEICKSYSTMPALSGFCAAPESPADCTAALGTQVFLWIYLVILPANFLLYNFIREIVRRYAVRKTFVTVSQSRELDPKNDKILFLRPIDKLQIDLKNRSFSVLSRILSLGRMRPTLDYLLLEEYMETHRPAALYDTRELDDSAAPGGYFRGVSHPIPRIPADRTNWEEVVRREAASAAAIVHYAGDGVGILKEMLEIVGPCPNLRNKTIFVFDPGLPEITRRFMQEVVEKDREDTLPENVDDVLAAYTKNGSDWYFLTSAPIVSRSKRGTTLAHSENAHRIALRYYFRCA